MTLSRDGVFKVLSWAEKTNNQEVNRYSEEKTSGNCLQVFQIEREFIPGFILIHKVVEGVEQEELVDLGDGDIPEKEISGGGNLQIYLVPFWGTARETQL